MTKAEKQPVDLKDDELDRVQGAGTTELVGDELGIPVSGKTGKVDGSAGDRAAASYISGGKGNDR